MKTPQYVKLFTILLSSLLCLLLTEISYAASQPPMPVGRVVWIKGNLRAIMANNEERILKNKSIVYLNDTLVTDSVSQAQVGFTDQSQMTFRENTKFNVTRYKYSTNSKSSGKQSAMNLLEGGFRTITGAVAKSTPKNYSINTPVATIGVRGTEYRVAIEGDTTYMGWYSGTPCIRAKKRPECEKDGQKQNAKMAAESPDHKRDDVICLSEKLRWVKVPSCGKPELLATKPDALGDDLTITKTFIDPFVIDGIENNNNRSNNFCIR